MHLGLGLGLGSSKQLAGGYPYQNAEARSYVQAMSVEPTDYVKGLIDAFVSDGKADGWWATRDIIYIFALHDEQAAKINLRNPGTHNLTEVGTVTWAEYEGYTGVDSSNYLSLGVGPSGLTEWAQNSASMSFYIRTFTSGPIVGRSTSGPTVLATTGSAPNVRMNDAAGGTDHTWSAGLWQVSRGNSSNYTLRLDDGDRVTKNATSSALASNTIYLLRHATGGGTHELSYFDIGGAKTSQQELDFQSSLATLLAGLFPVEVDAVVYGATPGGITAAYEASRQGLSVVLVGGWREKHPGGMMSGGLGATDIDSYLAAGGLGYAAIKRMREANGQSFDGTLFRFEPKYALEVFNEMLVEESIPFHNFSGGVSQVTKVGARITEMRTTNGRIYRARVWTDSSYEGDLMAMAGVTKRKSREAASGSVGDGQNGYRGTTTGGGNSAHQFRILGGTDFYNVDPWIIPGDTNSGLLPYVVPKPATSVNDSDPNQQAFNFRLVLTNGASRRIPFEDKKPPGYNKQKYELLFRWLAAMTDDGKVFNVGYGINSFLFFGRVNDGINGVDVFDVNSAGGFSTDCVGANFNYLEATYAQREVIWKEHQSWVLGLLYAHCFEDDPRVVTGLRNAVKNYGWVSDHFLDPWPGDPMYFPYQMYVREGWRMVSDYIFRGQDITGTDGTEPTSLHTISCGSYAMDSHHCQRLADEVSPGVWRVWNEGNFEVTLSGNKRYPVPYEIVIPKTADCTNLWASFAISASHQAFGSVRMEITHMQTGQSIGMAMAIAFEQDINCQAVVDHWEEFKTRMDDTPEDVKPVLPEVF